MHSERSCPACGAVLTGQEVPNGTVWECRTHGVRAWFFEDGPQRLLLPKP